MTIKLARPLIWLLFIGYTSCLVYWMFLGFGRNMHTTGQLAYNVVPFRTIGMYVLHVDSFSTRTWVINLFGNIGLFMPYGILLPYLFRSAKRYGTFLLYFGCPLVGLELLQMLLRVGSFDVDDVILNLLGASISFVLFAAAKRSLAGRESNRRYKM
ncbi:VanZ family protein [Paenibacillus sp. V4I5]|uniref:VanZ family protein n=1 Tax=Paenibacillus sp. V4I5 TaxID=3042306 RepID=UPI00278F6653|nr:VanZ family protein [Paenibacillus sp. V4I5]MDQ0918252.1 glycopeptide antibiotics resistance protein [Paenibacillus sp. V4I5]